MQTENILVSAGLDFEVEKRPHYYRTVSNSGDTFTESEMSCGIHRTDTGEEIGSVTKSYAVCQPWEILRPFLEACKDGHLQHVGGRAIDGGRRFCLTFDTGQNEIRGDIIKRRLIVGGSNDGSWSTFIKTFSYRQICSNGLMGFGMDDVFRVRHTKNWSVRYRDVLDRLKRLDQWFDKAIQRYEHLFEIKMDRIQMIKATQELLGIENINEASGRKKNQQNDIMYLSEYGKGIHQNGNILGTGAAWFNAVAEYYDHHSASNEQKRYVSSHFGNGANQIKKAYQILQKV